MNLNSDIVIFGDNNSLELMKKARRPNKPSLLGMVNAELETLQPCSWPSFKASRKEFELNNGTHPIDVPSVELGCIWSSKLAMQGQSMQQHPDYEWNIWLDIGMHDP